ncbi:MAG: small basic family protein [Clostridiaceae bacterium]|nr:small basic family protein [Clostridiaceae bacterium]
MIIAIGLMIGLVLGLFVPIHIPSQYSPYVAIAILAALDSVFGGMRASVQKNFDMRIFISGFFGNALLAAMLTYIGKKLDLDLYLAAVIAFGARLFQNFAFIRRFILNKYVKNDNI